MIHEMKDENKEKKQLIEELIRPYQGVVESGIFREASYEK